MIVDEGLKSTVISYNWPLLQHQCTVLLNTVETHELVHHVDRLIIV